MTAYLEYWIELFNFLLVGIASSAYKCGDDGVYSMALTWLSSHTHTLHIHQLRLASQLCQTFTFYSTFAVIIAFTFASNAR